MPKQDKPLAHNAVTGWGDEDKDALIRELKQKLADVEAKAEQAAKLPSMFEGVKMGDLRCLAKCDIMILPPEKNGQYREGAIIRKGAVLPFDPTNPPEGFNGLEEDVHYEVRYV